MSFADRPNHSTSTAERVVTTYPPRRRFRPYVLNAFEVPGVEGAIDLHCHASLGQQDAYSVAQLASKSKFGGILYKSYGTRARPMPAFRAMVEELARWAESEQLEPTKCWVGSIFGRGMGPVDLPRLREELEDGAAAVWLPVPNSANTLSKIGAPPSWWDKTADPKLHTGPLPWDEALKYGRYMLDDAGKLKPEYAEAIRMVAEHGRALFFGHPTHQEIWAVIDLLDAIGYKNAVIDHPYSPFVDLTVDEMKQVAAKGILLNFTYDELSPMLGIDPGEMYGAIRAVGVEHFSLSSDAGDQLFPNSIECMRLIIGFMRAYGCSDADITTLVTTNPSRVLGLARGL
jgi:hypothetical protein